MQTTRWSRKRKTVSAVCGQNAAELFGLKLIPTADEGGGTAAEGRG